MTEHHRTTVTTTEETPDPQAREPASSYARHTVYDPYSQRRLTLYRWTQAIYLVFGVLEALLFIRFLLRLLGANPAAPFTDFIYSVTFPFVAPFIGVFGTTEIEGGAVLEPHSLLAMVMYGLLSWLIVKLLWVTFGETRTAVTRTTSEVHHPED